MYLGPIYALWHQPVTKKDLFHQGKWSLGWSWMRGRKAGSGSMHQFFAVKWCPLMVYTLHTTLSSCSSLENPKWNKHAQANSCLAVSSVATFLLQVITAHSDADILSDQLMCWWSSNISKILFQGIWKINTSYTNRINTGLKYCSPC